MAADNGTAIEKGVTKQRNSLVLLYKRIGKRLRAIRIEQEETQVRLSSQVGITQAFLSSIESGKKANWDVLSRISEELGTKLEIVILEASYDVTRLTPAHRRSLLRTIRMFTQM